MSKKYIIEIEDEPLVKKSCLHGEEAVYKAVGFNSLVFDKTGLEKLKSMAQFDLDRCNELEAVAKNNYKKGYNKGLHDAWDAAKKIEGMTCEECCDVFDIDFDDCDFVLNRLTALEAMDKLEIYEMKNAEEIRIGDEVIAINGSFEPYVVTDLFNNYVYGIDKHGRYRGLNRGESDFKKTGRYFPEVAQLLNKLKDD